MPATSRSGERLSRRSGSGRAGSPSKSRIAQPRSREHRLAEVQVAVGADHVAAGADVRERCSFSRTSWPRPRIGAGRLGLGQVDGRCARSARRRRRSGSTAPPCDGSSGANAGSELSEPSAVCSSPITSPSARRLVEQPVGVARRARPARAPSRRARRARNSCRIPSVASMRRPSTSYQPASDAMLREAARGQEAQQLELGVHARLDAPERLQDQLVAEHDRGVGLLDADRAHVDRPAQAGARRLAPSGRRARPRRP